MEKRIIIGFRAVDMFTGCNPKPIEYGMVGNEEAARVIVSPGKIICSTCEAFNRCKKNFIIVNAEMPSKVSHFSDS